MCPSCEGLTVFDYGHGIIYIYIYIRTLIRYYAKLIINLSIAYPFGCKVQPGACGMVPEMISAELSKVSNYISQIVQ